MRPQKKTTFRVRSSSHRKWRRNEEVALINFIKKNRGFEKPTARVYYTRFLFETGIDVDWKLVRAKVRNMRVSYRKAKEHESNNSESTELAVADLRNKMLKICWFVDEFDVLFPLNNEVDQYYDPFLDDEFSKDASSCNVDKNNFVREEESTVSSLSKILDGDIVPAEKNMLNIKAEERNNYTTIKLQESEKATNKLNLGREDDQDIALKNREIKSKLYQTPFRNRSNPIRKWARHEEVAIISFLKENRDFEHPNARIYYTKFIDDNGVDAEWQHVRNKVRNMRVSYRKAKELEIKEGDSYNCNIQALRNQILKICWFVDDFDIIFPNEMDKSTSLNIYKTPDLLLDDDISKEESITYLENSSNNLKNNFLIEDDSTSSISSTMDGDMSIVQNNLFNLKKQKRDEDTNFKQQELNLAKDKLNFEKEKFRQEIRLKEKEIENEEKLKIMEFEMKERIAIKKLELEERLALRSKKMPNNSYNDIYHNLT